MKKFFTIICILFISLKAYALEKIGIVTDSILTPVNSYNAYYTTPEFFAQDIRGQLLKRNVDVLQIDSVRNSIINSKLTQKDLQNLKSMQQGYYIDYTLLKKIAKSLKVKKIIVVTMGMDIQRDFLKNTLWNSANIGGFDVVNPTHRVSVYVSLVNVENETILWESIYAKNIRNNKMKNLDTTISNNYEGMLRLKEYSKYISPDIAYNVKMKLTNPLYVEAPTPITKENIKQYAKDKHNIGTKKELSEIDRKKWDTEKLKEDTKNNITTKAKNTKNHIKSGINKVKARFKKTKNSTLL